MVTMHNPMHVSHSAVLPQMRLRGARAELIQAPLFCSSQRAPAAGHGNTSSTLQTFPTPAQSFFWSTLNIANSTRSVAQCSYVTVNTALNPKIDAVTEGPLYYHIAPIGTFFVSVPA